MDSVDLNKCPFHNTDLILLESGGKQCPTCTRIWDEVEVEGSTTLQSRPIRVRMVKKPEVGDRYDDIFKTENG